MEITKSNYLKFKQKENFVVGILIYWLKKNCHAITCRNNLPQTNY